MNKKHHKSWLYDAVQMTYLPPEAYKLLAVLVWEFDARFIGELEFTNGQVGRMAELKQGVLFRARKRLEKAGLITLKRKHCIDTGRVLSWIYTLTIDQYLDGYNHAE